MKMKIKQLIYFFTILAILFIPYIFNVEIYNYFIKNYDTCVKELFLIFVNLFQTLVLLIITIFNLKINSDFLMIPLLISENEETTNNEMESCPENEKLPESGVPDSPEYDVTQRIVGEAGTGTINFSDNRSDSNNLTQDSNLTSNSPTPKSRSIFTDIEKEWKTGEWAPGLGNYNSQAPTEELNETKLESKKIAEVDQKTLKTNLEIIEQANKIRKLREQARETKDLAFFQNIYQNINEINNSFVLPNEMVADQGAWLEKVNSSELMKNHQSFKPNDFNFRDNRELNPNTWFNKTIDYYNRENKKK
jgi:hypothetical protein